MTEYKIFSVQIPNSPFIEYYKSVSADDLRVYLIDEFGLDALELMATEVEQIEIVAADNIMIHVDDQCEPRTDERESLASLAARAGGGVFCLAICELNKKR